MHFIFTKLDLDYICTDECYSYTYCKKYTFVLNKVLTSKFSKPKMSRMPIDLKFSFPLTFWLILRMIQEKHWEYNAIATESRESTACNNERETQDMVRTGVIASWKKQRSIWMLKMHVLVCVYLLYSEWRADFLSSEYYRALSQDFRQLESIQAQQLTGITDHWMHGQSCVIPAPLIYLGFNLASHTRHEAFTDLV